MAYAHRTPGPPAGRRRCWGLPLCTPVAPQVLGLAGAGMLCVAPLAAMPQKLVAGTREVFGFPVPGGLPAGAVLHGEAIALDLMTMDVWLSNRVEVQVK